jgi:glutamyl/glutaminyl-tRNA synthetase
MTSLYRGRLAPSPTGLLHLGHASTFRAAQFRAEAAGGTLLLRNEDLDPQRSKPEFVDAMIEDLAWLGIGWEPPMVSQSEHGALYRAAFERLLAEGYVYPCSCSRKDLARMMHAPHEDVDDEPVYDGHCRPVGEALSRDVVHGMNYRFRVPDGEAIRFTDGNLGEQIFTAGVDFGDFLVWRKDGLPSYQLACVVDDAAMKITEVVRGADLLKSTARQMLLQRALGLSAVAYFHTQLLVDEHGMRLAKRHDALALRTLRQQGLTPEDVLRMIG